MKLPTEIIIAGSKFRLEPAPGYRKTDNFWGSVTFSERLVEYDTTLSDRNQLMTILHEIGHIIQRANRHRLNERDADRSARALWKLVRENPELFRAILRVK